MLKNRKFLYGLISFFIAHIIYSIAIILQFGFHLYIGLLFLVVIYIGIFLKIIIPTTGKLKWYVVMYSISLMAGLILALGQPNLFSNFNNLALGIGIVLFTLSDSILAYNKFIRNFKSAQFAILSTYYLAQTFIVFSTTVYPN